MMIKELPSHSASFATTTTGGMKEHFLLLVIWISQNLNLESTLEV